MCYQRTRKCIGMRSYMIEEVVTVAMPVSEKIVIRKNRIMSENLDNRAKRLSIVTGIHGDELKQQLANVKKLGTEEFDETISLPLGQPRSYWLFANAYKPVEVAAKLKLPIFVLQGERDYQVTMEDFGLWRSGLLRCKNAYFKSYPKLNHLLQEGSGKATPFEYSHASPVPAYVMDDIASFVRGKQNTL